MPLRFASTLVLVSLLVITSACSQRAGRSGGEQTSADGGMPSDLSLRGVERIQPDALFAEPAPDLATRRVQERSEAEERARSAALRDVYFTYDSALLDDAGMKTLDEDARRLLSRREGGLRIEGHCDERGSAAYNFVLGEKRALAVQQYLMELGVPGERLTVMSYGEERPACLEHSETCHQRNRRGHLVITR